MRWLIRYTRDDREHRHLLPVTVEVHHDDDVPAEAVRAAWLKQHPGRKIIGLYASQEEVMRG